MQDPRPDNNRRRAANRQLQFQRYLGGYRNATGSDAPIAAVAAVDPLDLMQVTDAYFTEPETERPLVRDVDDLPPAPPRRPRTTLGPGGGRNARGQRRNRPSQSEVGRRLDIRA